MRAALWRGWGFSGKENGRGKTIIKLLFSSLCVLPNMIRIAAARVPAMIFCLASGPDELNQLWTQTSGTINYNRTFFLEVYFFFYRHLHRNRKNDKIIQDTKEHDLRDKSWDVSCTENVLVSHMVYRSLKIKHVECWWFLQEEREE